MNPHDNMRKLINLVESAQSPGLNDYSREDDDKREHPFASQLTQRNDDQDRDSDDELEEGSIDNHNGDLEKRFDQLENRYIKTRRLLGLINQDKIEYSPVNKDALLRQKQQKSEVMGMMNSMRAEMNKIMGQLGWSPEEVAYHKERMGLDREFGKPSEIFTHQRPEVKIPVPPREAPAPAAEPKFSWYDKFKQSMSKLRQPEMATEDVVDEAKQPIMDEPTFKQLNDAIWSTWQCIGPDVYQAVEEYGEGEVSNADAVESCIDADRLRMYGDPSNHAGLDGSVVGNAAQDLIRQLVLAHGYEPVLKYLCKRIQLA